MRLFSRLRLEFQIRAAKKAYEEARESSPPGHIDAATLRALSRYGDLCLEYINHRLAKHVA